MECAKPINIRVKDKNMLVACSNCMLCRKSRATEWTMRILAEMGYSNTAYFITLTYDDENLPYNMNLNPNDLKNFWKRARKAGLVETGKQLKYYACGEYGDQNLRPHYHAIVLNMKLDLTKMYQEIDMNGKINIRSAEIDKIWGMGKNAIGGAQRESIFYVTGYIRKKLNGKKAKEEYGENIPPFARSSGNIGFQYVKDNAEQILKNGYIPYDNGSKRKIPRTWLRWLEKLGYEKELREMKWKIESQQVEDITKEIETITKYLNEDYDETYNYLKIQEKFNGTKTGTLRNWRQVMTERNSILRENELKTKDLTRYL